jgi:succinoglycan biosynthesis transport protein ExoP
MDGIQPLAGHAAPVLARPVSPAHPWAVAPAPPTKSAGDYLRALRRRVWLVLMIGLVIGMAGTVWTLRRPNVYRASAQILIVPPQFDAALAGIVPHDVGRLDRETVEKYVPNRLAKLRGLGLARKVVADPGIAQLAGPGGDVAAELVAQLQTRNLPGTNIFDVFLEGTDPARTALLLNTLLEEFQNDAKRDSTDTIEASKRHAEQSLKELQDELANLDRNIASHLKANALVFAPGGKNLLQDQYVFLNSMLIQKRLRHEDLRHEAQIAQLYPTRGLAAPSPLDTQLAELESMKKYYLRQARYVKTIARNFDSDPSARIVTEKLATVMDEIDQLKRSRPARPPDLTTMMLAANGEEIHKLDQEVKSLLQRLQESMPEDQKYRSLLDQREQTAESIATMRARLSNFEMLSKTQKNPVEILMPAEVPTVPIRPNRPLMIGIISVLGFLLGVGLVCLWEHFDHSVKVPEHLTAGLTLPLFAVIPRIRRTALVHRGGHLWTPGAPASLEADAYRNLRASLLGLTGPRGPIVTLLVTSAKPGEGKSTTALNLAATCARAGERTLLIDVDLRRPSLSDVFGETRHELGLVDVLRDDLPWQRAVRHTDLPNLDFLPTGQTMDIPIEILGTREIQQLIAAVSGHYDRVILDGPAVLGMADCRMLGRLVDAALLVVRCGAHDIRPPRRAKAMLEQSQVPIAGLVFNGLLDDLPNWASYGAGHSYSEYHEGPPEGQATGRSQALGGPCAEEVIAGAAAGGD